MNSLGVPRGSSYCIAYGVSGNGSRIIGFCDSLGAFIWQDGQMQGLLDLLVAQGATGLDGWRLYQASAISPDGQWVVGGGINPQGVGEAFRVQLNAVPIPPTGLLLLTGLCGAVMRTTRRRRRGPAN